MTVIPFILLFLFIPAILFGVPKFRRSQGAWVLAFKIVPLGCLVSVLLFVVIMATGLVSVLMSTETEFVLIIPSIAVGILFIYWFARLIKRFHDDATPLPIKHLAGVYCLYAGMFVLIGVAIQFYLLSVYYRGEPGPMRAFDLPIQGEVTWVFEEKPIHPFLAEYDYRLRFKRDGQDVVYDLWRNCGGRTAFNVYEMQDGRFCLVDKDGCYVAAPHEAKLWMVDCTYKFVAPMTPSINGVAPTSWSLHFGEQSGSIQLAFCGIVTEGKLLANELDGMKFYGTITNGFTPASETKEIEYLSRPAVPLPQKAEDAP